MKKFMEKMKYKAARFMYGRYGADELSQFILTVTCILLVISTIFRIMPLYYVALVLLIWAQFRMYSKNIAKRRKECKAYLSLKYKVQRPFKIMKLNRTDKEYKHFACPNCGRIVRVPRGHGKITVTCRQCGKQFDRKS